MRSVLFAALAASVVSMQPATAADYTIKFGTVAPDDTPWSEVLMDFKKQIEKDSGGRVDVKVYLNGKLGDEHAMLQKMAFGQLNGGGFSTGGMSKVVPELQLLELPFLFESKTEADYIMDQVIRPELVAALEKKNLHLWIWAENGWLDLGSKTPIHTPAELAAAKVVMQESQVQLETYKAMGVSPTPLPVPEILGGLQTGMVDTYAGSPVFSTAAQWFAYTGHWADVDFIYQPAAVVFSKKFWDGLPEDLRKIIDDYAPSKQTEVREAVRGLDAELFEGFQENGMTLYKWTPEEREVFRKKAWASHQAMVDNGAFPKALLDKVYAALEAYRAKTP